MRVTSKVASGRTGRISSGDDTARERILGESLLFAIILAHNLQVMEHDTTRVRQKRTERVVSIG